jgi:TonB family protein
VFRFRLTQDHPDEIFRKAVLLSLLLHLALWAGFALKHFFGDGLRETIEIDLTQPFRVGGNPLLKTGGGDREDKPAKPGPRPLSETKPLEKPEPPKDWVLPGPKTTEVEKPHLESPPQQASPTGVPGVPSEGYQGTGNGVGGGAGEGGGIPLTQFPKLLNRAEVLQLLRQNYPLAERQAEREGVVVVDLHLSETGAVTGVDVIESAGLSFDQVARMVARKMRFTPARMQTQAVAVKIRQSIAFRLEDE